MITDVTIKRWKRDALETQFDLTNSGHSNPNLNLQCSRVAKLCNEIENLRFKLDKINLNKDQEGPHGQT